MLIVKNRLDSLLTEDEVTIDEVSLKTGISILTLSAILSNSLTPSVFVAIILSNFFRCSVEDIFYLEIEE